MRAPWDEAKSVPEAVARRCIEVAGLGYDARPSISGNVKCYRFRPVNNVQNDTSIRNGCRLLGHQLEDVTVPHTIAYRVVDRPDVVIDEIVASCNGDMRGAIKALLLVNEQLESELNHLYEAAASGSPTERAATK